MLIGPLLLSSIQSVNIHTIEDAMVALVAETGITTITIGVAAVVVETITATEVVEIWVEGTTMEVIMAVVDMAGAIIIITDTIHRATTMETVEVIREEADIIHANELIEIIGMVVVGEAMTTRAPPTIINTTTITTTTIING